MMYLSWSLYAAAYLAVAIVFLFGAKKLFDWLTPYSVDAQLTEKDNPAVGLVLSGFLLGVVAIIFGTFSVEGDGESVSMTRFAAEIGPVALYVVVGMVMLFFAGVVNDRLVLYRFSNAKEIVGDRNLGVAAIMAATYLGSGLIIGGGIQGSFSLSSAFLAYGVGQVGLVLYARLYQAMTSYDDLEEIGEKDNVAAGVAFAGNLLAYAIILSKGVSLGADGLETWRDCAFHFLYYAVAGAILLFVVRFVTDRVFLPKAKLSKEIAEDRNLSAGFVEAAVAVAVSVVLAVCL